MSLSVSRAQAADQAHNMAVVDGGETEVTVSDVELLIPQAVKALCDAIVKTREIYRLQKDAAVSITNGVGTLPDDMMADTIPNEKGGLVTLARTDITDPQPVGACAYFDDEAALYRLHPGGEQKIYFAVRGADGSGGLIYMRSGNRTLVSGTATVKATFVYTFETLPGQLEDEFIKLLADMARTKMNAQSSVPVTTATNAEQQGGSGGA